MFENFYPSLMLNNIYEIDIDKLKKNNISLLIFDIDNTLVPYNEPTASEKILTYMKNLQDHDFSVALVSNNKAERVERFNESLALFHVAAAMKPFKRGLKQVMRHFHAEKPNTAIVGDQVFTDVYGGNRLGVFTILVTPIEGREGWFFRIKRNLENIVINHMKKRKK